MIAHGHFNSGLWHGVHGGSGRAVAGAITLLVALVLSLTAAGFLLTWHHAAPAIEPAAPAVVPPPVDQRPDTAPSIQPMPVRRNAELRV
jgi:hypothetical protein